MTVNLSEIIDVLNFTDEYSHFFLDKTNGEIVWVSDMGMTMKEQKKDAAEKSRRGYPGR